VAQPFQAVRVSPTRGFRTGPREPTPTAVEEAGAFFFLVEACPQSFRRASLPAIFETLAGRSLRTGLDVSSAFPLQLSTVDCQPLLPRSSTSQQSRVTDIR
jgi:hypothetical protein